VRVRTVDVEEGSKIDVRVVSLPTCGSDQRMERRHGPDRRWRCWTMDLACTHDGGRGNAANTRENVSTVPVCNDVGFPCISPGGPFIKALDEGVVGMGVGGQRRLIVPPQYGYGNKQVQEIPPGSTLQVDLELLSIKTNPLQRKKNEG